VIGVAFLTRSLNNNYYEIGFTRLDVVYIRPVLYIKVRLQSTELKPRRGGLTNFHIVIAYAGDLNAWGSSSAFCAANLNPSISRSALDPSRDAGQ
jgi:hypothetical protein